MTAKVTYQQTALVLQGGGALGAYQAGVAEALLAKGYEPDWYAGISIGAINAAIMAGNEPERRIERLRQFWDEVTSEVSLPAPSFATGLRALYNVWSAQFAALAGAPGFFYPRIPPAFMRPPGSAGALSVYDSSPLRATLEKLVDFDRINSGKPRLSVGAVNVRTGNFIYFDNAAQRIGPEHIMASGALPPGLPPIEIGGELYWDGGLVSNTPLSRVLESGPERDTLVFQVDLFSARGNVPRDICEVEERRKDIVYSSRTRLNTDVFGNTYALRRALRKLHGLLPEEARNRPDVQALHKLGDGHRIAIVHLIYRRRAYEIEGADYEFSRSSMLEHWKCGFDDANWTCDRPLWTEPSSEDLGIRVFDLTLDREQTYARRS